MPTYANGESGFSVRAKTNAGITAAEVRKIIPFDAGGSSATARPTAVDGYTLTANDRLYWENHGDSEPENALGTDLIAGPGPGAVYVNTQTGTSYTSVLGDAGKVVDMDNASANTFTIPTNASVAYVVGTCMEVSQLGAGTTTIQGDTGVTVNGVSAGSEDLAAQYAGAVLRKVATDAWIVRGDLT